ncbi:MAG: phosphomethylpyrimidine synthase ThiC [Phycisphaerae bacterium]|nr:phosphomethylpyrimidine synthase ThiC [Phycisphaerae bacterium]
MSTQLNCARQDLITDAMRAVAQAESLDAEQVRSHLAAGRLVIPANRIRVRGPLRPTGIGRPVRTKVNANIGTSSERSSLQAELEKMRVALEVGADAIMDLSTGGDLDAIREALLEACPVPFGTVPIYQVIQGRGVEDVTVEVILDVIERQARQGVDFFTLHAGLLREYLPLVERRVAGIVSRGGALLARWMRHHNRQNPLYERFDDLCAILAEHDVCFSLGDALRPGAIADATDEAQLAELRTLGDLVQRAWDKGCQVMVEGPGHIPFNQIQYNMEIQQQVCHGAPFYVLGPVVTDLAPGYDHITSAIGGTAAAFYGASFLCYVTPREHLGLPTVEDVRTGVVAAKIAAHAADIARGLPGASDADRRISLARRDFDWRAHLGGSLDPVTATRMYREACQDSRALQDRDADFCTMCGEQWCSLRVNKELRQGSAPGA